MTKKLNAIERLEEALNEKDARIETLEAKLEEINDPDKFRWTRHTNSDQDPNPELPVPRLEIRYEALDKDWYSRRAIYALVYKHFIGHIVTVPLGETIIRGSNKPTLERFPSAVEGRPGPIDGLPFRDGAHIYNEMKQLNLPGFLICEDKVLKLDPKDR